MQVGTTIKAPNGTAVANTAVTAALNSRRSNVNGYAIGATTDDAVSLADAISSADPNVSATARMYRR